MRAEHEYHDDDEYGIEQRAYSCPHCNDFPVVVRDGQCCNCYEELPP